MVLAEHTEGGLEVVKLQMEASHEGGYKLISGSSHTVWDSTSMSFAFKKGFG